jgi:probable rRNA maturation factor
MIVVDVTSTLSAPIDRKLLQRAAVAALSGRIHSASVSVAVIGNHRMRGLNRDALGHDYVTDVISFDHGDSPEGRVIELFVCAPFAERAARMHRVPAVQELARYVVHGCLHSAGYDDKTPKQQTAMWQAQEAVMRRLFGKAYASSV